MFVRIAITKIRDGFEEEFHKIQSEIHKILSSQGVQILGYYYCKKNNTVYCPADWGSRDHLTTIAKNLKNDTYYMELHERSHKIILDNELKEVDIQPNGYDYDYET